MTKELKTRKHLIKKNIFELLGENLREKPGWLVGYFMMLF
jgi:hypothetical protein